MRYKGILSVLFVYAQDKLVDTLSFSMFIYTNHPSVKHDSGNLLNLEILVKLHRNTAQ